MTRTRRPLFSIAVIFLMAGLLLSFGCTGKGLVGASEGDRFTFCVYGDTRTGHDAHGKVVEHLVKLKPDFVVHTGDLVANGNKEEQWETFFEISGPLFETVPFYPVKGNHDGDPEAFAKRFTLPPGTSGPKPYYSFDKGQGHFVVLDSMQDYSPGSPMRTWLVRDLEENELSLIFVFQHHPLYSAVMKRKKDTQELVAVPDNAGLISALRQLLIDYGVTAVWTGHYHHYYRTERDGIAYITTGGGGAPLYPIAEEKLRPGDVAFKDYHMVKVEVDGTTARCQAILTDGSVVDEFVLRPRSKEKETPELASVVKSVAE